MMDASIRRLFLIAALASSGACTSAQLERIPDPPPPPIDNFLAVSGRFCTEDPKAVEFPVKIMFIVDVSQSMAVTDPPDPLDPMNLSGRARAVTEVIDALAGTPGVEIAIITFGSGANDVTHGFQPIFTAPQVAMMLTTAAQLNSMT